MVRKGLLSVTLSVLILTGAGGPLGVVAQNTNTTCSASGQIKCFEGVSVERLCANEIVRKEVCGCLEGIECAGVGEEINKTSTLPPFQCTTRLESIISTPYLLSQSLDTTPYLHHTIHARLTSIATITLLLLILPTLIILLRKTTRHRITITTHSIMTLTILSLLLAESIIHYPDNSRDISLIEVIRSLCETGLVGSLGYISYRRFNINVPRWIRLIPPLTSTLLVSIGRIAATSTYYIATSTMDIHTMKKHLDMRPGFAGVSAIGYGISLVLYLSLYYYTVYVLPPNNQDDDAVRQRAPVCVFVLVLPILSIVIAVMEWNLKSVDYNPIFISLLPTGCAWVIGIWWCWEMSILPNVQVIGVDEIGGWRVSISGMVYTGDGRVEVEEMCVDGWRYTPTGMVYTYDKTDVDQQFTHYAEEQEYEGRPEEEGDQSTGYPKRTSSIYSTPPTDPLPPWAHEMGSILIAHTPYTPRHSDELMIVPGDRVQVLRMFPDGWWMVVEMRPGGGVGIVPAGCLGAG